MAGASTKKRSHADSAAAGKLQRPKKKQKKVPQYHSDSEEDLDNALVDDIASISGSDIGSESDIDTPTFTSTKEYKGSTTIGKSAKKNSGEDGLDSHEDGAGAESNDDVDDDDDEFTHSEGETSNMGSKRPKSKRNDPGAFATSLQKILSTVRWHLDSHDDNSVAYKPCV
jgi:hypothetical protein